SRRADLLENQLRSQIDQVMQKNEQISKINQLLNALGEVRGKISANAKASDPVTITSRVEEAAKEAGVTLRPIKNLGELDTQISDVKAMLDSISNSQQMDMLRLQSLSNKRNEAFEIMT